VALEMNTVRQEIGLTKDKLLLFA